MSLHESMELRPKQLRARPLYGTHSLCKRETKRTRSEDGQQLHQWGWPVAVQAPIGEHSVGFTASVTRGVAGATTFTGARRGKLACERAAPRASLKIPQAPRNPRMGG
jgi:hypothetical protein